MTQITPKAAAKRRRVIEAASLVFRRHGFARTSMDAIAEAAGISRPSLYLVFSSKEEAFAAAVHHLGEVALAGLRAGVAEHETLEARLRYLCEAWAGAGHDRMKENPDAKDLTDPALAPVREVYAKVQGLIAEQLAEAVAASRLDITATDIAGMLVSAMRGFKEMAADGVEVRRLIGTQVALVLGALDP
jgi:AcrR family transcriptional regulator